ncbi:hypothetical protein JCM1840_006487 [Sporobolomyces johnsonii]
MAAPRSTETCAQSRASQPAAAAAFSSDNNSAVSSHRSLPASIAEALPAPSHAQANVVAAKEGLHAQSDSGAEAVSIPWELVSELLVDRAITTSDLRQGDPLKVVVQAVPAAEALSTAFLAPTCLFKRRSTSISLLPLTTNPTRSLSRHHR